MKIEQEVSSMSIARLGRSVRTVLAVAMMAALASVGVAFAQGDHHNADHYAKASADTQQGACPVPTGAVSESEDGTVQVGLVPGSAPSAGPKQQSGSVPAGAAPPAAPPAGRAAPACTVSPAQKEATVVAAHR
jgi:hypothetical protein